MDYVENWHTQLFPLLLVSMHVDLRCRIHTYIHRWLNTECDSSSVHFFCARDRHL